MTSQYMPHDFDSYHHHFHVSSQQTVSCPVVPPALTEEPLLMKQATQPLLSSVQFTSLEPSSDNLIEDKLHEEIAKTTKKPGKLRLLIILVIIGLGCAIYFLWYTPSTNSKTQIPSSFSTSTNKGNTNSSIATNAPTGTIQVYITGAVQHPGVYTLSSDARVYQLLQAAGGPLPNANLVALNLAQKLVDGQEIYVGQIGETPPIVGSTTNNSNNQGQLVNINTASAADLQQKLHLSAKSAQSIINYRQQHGPFTSVSDLQQAVSQTIYNKIKGLVTV